MVFRPGARCQKNLCPMSEKAMRTTKRTVSFQLTDQFLATKWRGFEGQGSNKRVRGKHHQKFLLFPLTVSANVLACASTLAYSLISQESHERRKTSSTGPP